MQNNISTVGSSTLPREQPLQHSRFIADGGSASGHVAACAGVIEGHESNDENAEISSIPNALVLFNPVIDTTDKGYGSEKFTPETQTELSPCHHVRKRLPPIHIVHGTDDKTVPFEHVEHVEHVEHPMRKKQATCASWSRSNAAGTVSSMFPFSRKGRRKISPPS